jgi:UDP-3-O-[3-hydroxymyristoyl] glucosamine N-acyltransferase
MVATTGELAKLLNAELVGNPDLPIDLLGEIEDCENPRTLVLALDPKRVKLLSKYKPQAVVLSEDIPELDAVKLITNKGKEILIDLLNYFFPEDHTGFISEKACIDDSAELGINVKVYPGVIIGHGVKIGDNSIIYPNVVIYEQSRIGSNVIIHANTTIGSDGYGFIRKADGHLKVPQKGKVVIEDNVEIGAGCTIDRATLKKTVIGRGSKLDNQVHIAHNVSIGQNCLLVSGVRIAGSVKVGNNVVLMGAAGIVDNVTIGDNSIVAAYTVVTKDYPANSKIYATPVGEDMDKAMKIRALCKKLPDLFERIKKLEKSS